MKALRTFRNLTGGRLPPLTRTALLSGLAIFILTLLIFRPTAGGLPPAPILARGVKLMPPGDPRTEQVVLLDSSAVYFPARRSARLGQGELGQAESTPFAKVDPAFQFDPNQPIARDSILQGTRPAIPSAARAIPLAEQEPFFTFGGRGYKDTALPPREAFFEVYTLIGGNKSILSGNIRLSEYIIPKINTKNINNNPLWSILEVVLGVDSLGKAPLGSLARSSGVPEVDKAVLAWAAQVDWGRQLPAGTYRLIVGP